MPRAGLSALAVVVMGCGGAATARGPHSALHPACGVDQRWTQGACRTVATGRAKVDAIAAVVADVKFDLEPTRAELAKIERGPFDHDTGVKLWEARGVVAAYAADTGAAATAFDRLLALDANHRLSCEIAPSATWLFEARRAAAHDRGTPELDITWAQGQRVGAPVPIEVEVVTDPDHLLRRASVVLRRRGEPTWRATEVTLPAPGDRAHLLLPATAGDAASALEIYARAYDADDNEVLVWADPRRPREIPLRYDPPPPWYRKWWVWTAIVGAVGATTGIVVYAVTREPGATLGPITPTAR